MHMHMQRIMKMTLFHCVTHCIEWDMAALEPGRIEANCNSSGGRACTRCECLGFI
jgi:hypothetical protein